MFEDPFTGSHAAAKGCPICSSLLAARAQLAVERGSPAIRLANLAGAHDAGFLRRRLKDLQSAARQLDEKLLAHQREHVSERHFRLWLGQRRILRIPLLTVKLSLRALKELSPGTVFEVIEFRAESAVILTRKGTFKCHSDALVESSSLI